MSETLNRKFDETSSHGLRLIALGYYDGATSGILQFLPELRTYVFDMVEQRDTEDEDVRAFMLRELPRSTFDQIVELCPKAWPVRWPVWVPRWKHPADIEELKSIEEIQALIKLAKKPELAIAWDNYANKVVAVAEIRDDYLSIQDWFSYLGLITDGTNSSD